MNDCVFFYGTLLTEFGRCQNAGIDKLLRYFGRGYIHAALFDVGLFPAAVPSDDGQVWGDVYCLKEPDTALARLDEIEGASTVDGSSDAGLYTRVKVTVTLDDGRAKEAWVYFYNAPLGHAERIASGDYRQYVQGSRYP